jgi:5-exo-hydroxycamphor dehydrogenase
MMSNGMGRRAVLVRTNRPVEVWARPMQVPGAGEVVVRVELAGVCGTDLHLWRGELPLPGPIGLGHEGVATIEELGNNVTTDYAGTRVKVGDRVCWSPVHPCYRCYECTVGNDPTQCPNLLSDLLRDAAEPPVACYSDFAHLPRGMAFYRIPDDTPSEAVIAFGCALPTMLQALERIGGIGLNQTVAIQGCGPVGLAATLLARISGARDIVVVGARKPRLEMARRLGATATIDKAEVPSADDRIAMTRDLTGGRGAEVVIEAAGAVPAFGEGIRLAARGGRYVVVGLWSAPGSVPVEPRYVNHMNLRIHGSSAFLGRHIYGAIEIARRHHRELPMAAAVTHRFPLEEAQLALEAVSHPATVKAVIIPAA